MGGNGEGHASTAHAVDMANKPALNITQDAQGLLDQKFPGQFAVVYDAVCRHFAGATKILIETFTEQEIGSEPHLAAEIDCPLDRKAFRNASHALIEELANRGLAIHIYLAVTKHYC